MKVIAVFPNIDKPESAQVLERVINFYKDKDVKLLLPNKAAAVFNHQELAVDEIYDENVDAGLTIGGDGTLLGECRKLYAKDTPTCGINIGTVGFLADIELPELEMRLEQLLNNNYRIVERTVLHGSVIRKGQKKMLGHAINDIVITKGGVSRMLHLGLSVDNYHVIDYKADGIIVSTATGSTAYSLSAGGPIIKPSVKGLLITPICPHTFSIRPMVVAEKDRIIVHVAAVHQDIQVTLDGQEYFSLEPGDDVSIRKARNNAKIIKFQDRNFYYTLKNKLWNNF